MSFWDIFKQIERPIQKDFGRLHDKIKRLLPKAEENELIKTACVAGLLARVAYIDFKIHDGEVTSMKKRLKFWSKLDEERVDAIVTVAIDEIADLSGLENHFYCHPLNDVMDGNEKFRVLETLFAIAASDGSVSSLESEEIRVICKGLRLEHAHYVAARASVLERLAILGNK